MQTEASLQTRKLISFPELKERFGIPFTRRHLLNLENEQKFPARVPVGEHRIAWLESEVDEWVNRKVEEARR
jgi:prophage regulatory protein